MIPTERRQIILDMVAEKGIVSIAELTERMHVSHMTIRRDLQKLEQQGAVIQVSGRVQSSTRVAHEPSHQIKTEPVSYTHLRAHETLNQSRMPSSA